jgi:hypothetical protein
MFNYSTADHFHFFIVLLENGNREKEIVQMEPLSLVANSTLLSLLKNGSVICLHGEPVVTIKFLPLTSPP